MKIFEKISLYFQVNKTFRPYLNDLEKQMAFFKVIEKNHSEEIASIYKRILEISPNKYESCRKLYENIDQKIEEHNREVELVTGFVDSWSMKGILNNPYSLKEDYLRKCSDIVSILKKYKRIDKKYAIFQDEAEDVQQNLQEICRQFDLYKKYKELFVIPEDKYANLELMRDIDTKSNEIVVTILKAKKAYYNFDKHDYLERIIYDHNELFFSKNANNPLFDNINGHSLDYEQRKAVLNKENSVLVVAGAGSGKTLTICGKVEYLLKEEKVKPSDILLLSYSKKSADDLQTKVTKIDKELTVGTFHKIGLDILKETQNKVFMVEDQYKAIIEEYFREEIKKRPHILQTILTYYGLYISTTKHDKKYTSEGELYEDLKKIDFTTLRTELLSLTNDFNSRETIKKELVKSFEEMAIANWYFINGIDYIYEAPYEHEVGTAEKRQYMPDFRLKNYPIYHEHYGIDKNGEASQFAGLESIEYVNGMKWKREIHKEYQTDCIETYSYEFEDGTVFKKLEEELKKRGVVFNPLTSEQVTEALKSVYENRLFKSFINLTRTFLSLYKATYRDDSGFELLKKSTFRNSYEKNRALLFLEIIKDLYHYYMDYLKKEDKIDFDDMILQAIEELDNTKSFNYKHIIVDEFQDISVSRMKFLKRLIKQGDSKLFAVGDDWQAIYRFSGCDLNIFLEFKKYFGDSAISKITTTFRNSQELQDIAGPFIRKNPEQFNKNINSTRHLEHPIRIMYYNDRKYDAFLNVLKIIHSQNESANVLILGRNNKDFEDIELDNRIFIDYKASSETKTVVKCTRYPKMNLSYSTVHGSKGLEEDYVILINADDNRIGFPNKMEDDELLDLVLSHKSNYEYAEERRLWYVALTRTKTYTFIIANKEMPSIFLKEIEDQCLVVNDKSLLLNNEESAIFCPKCKTGRLITRIRKTDNEEFFGCSNYPYCQYAIDDMRAVRRNKKCPNCGDFMVYKNGRFGAFFGCHSYPYCTYTEKYEN